MTKWSLTVFLLMISITVICAQSIDEEARKAANEAFSNSMFRNVLIIIGVGVVYYLFRANSNKNGNKE